MGHPILGERPDLVTLAVARAQAGQTDALHFLYVRFADDVCGYVNDVGAQLGRIQGHHPERLRGS